MSKHVVTTGSETIGGYEWCVRIENGRVELTRENEHVFLLFIKDVRALAALITAILLESEAPS